MAVTGKFGDENIELNNAAEEATLQELVDIMKKATTSGGKLDPKAMQGLTDSAKKNTSSLNDMLKSATRGADGLDELATESEKGQKAIKNFGSSMASTASNFAKSMTQASGEGAVKNVFEAATNGITDTIEAIGDVVPGGVGKAIAGGASAVIGTIGGAAGFFIGTMQEFGESFREQANMGFIAGEGIGAFNNKILESGMTFGQFNALLKENSENLRTMGGSVSQGARQVLRLRKSLQGQEEQFLRLGYAQEELAPMLAEYSAILERGASSRTISDQQLIEQSYEYAKSLRLMTDLTGKSAKELQDEAQAAATEAKNQAYLMDLERQGRAGASTTFGMISSDLARLAPGYENLFKDYNTQYGVAMSATTGILESQNPALAGVLREMKEGIANGTINETNARDIFIQKIKENEEGINQGLRNIANLAQAGIEGTEGVGVAIKNLNDIFKLDLEAAKTNLDKAKTTKDELTTSYVSLSNANQNLARIQNELANAIGAAGTKFGLVGGIESATDALKSWTEALRPEFSAERLSAGAEAATRVGEGGLVEPVPQNLGRGGTRPLTSAQQQQLADFERFEGMSDEELAQIGMRRSIASGSGLFGSDFLSSWVGDNIYEKVNDRNMPGNTPTVSEKRFARGGIIPDMGPDGISIRAGDGVSEAVVPLPDGRNIPVNMSTDFKQTNQLLGSLISINRAMLQAMEQSNNISRTSAMYAR